MKAYKRGNVNFCIRLRKHVKSINVMTSNPFQYLADNFNIPVYVAFTHQQSNNGKNITVQPTIQPTTTYKLYMPMKSPEKRKHNIKDMKDYDSFLYGVHKNSLIFFARMGKQIVHIDPWMTNNNDCFVNGVRNDVIGVFPQSKWGYCLANAIKSELNRQNLTMSDSNLKIIESFVLVD